MPIGITTTALLTHTELIGPTQFRHYTACGFRHQHRVGALALRPLEKTETQAQAQ